MEQDFESELKRIDHLLDEYIRQDVIEACNEASTNAVESFNSWLKRRQAALDAQYQVIEQDRIELDEEGKRLDANESDHSDVVKRYNRQVREHNARIEKHREAREELRREAKERGAEVDAYQAKRKQKAESYLGWVRQRGPHKLSRDLDELYAKMSQADRGTFSGLAPLLERARTMRRDLAWQARKSQQAAENGLLLVPTIVCGSEECLMLVDTGASIVSVTPELVEVLGLGDSVGDEIELHLPGGICINAPTVRLSQLVVHGVLARDIDAAVIPGSNMGVDGCLGLNFLNEFSYRIEKARPQRLHLLPPTSTESQSESYDIFIGYEVDDFRFAHEVHNAIVSAGQRPFLAELCLPSVERADQSETIEAVIADTTHFVMVTSSPDRLRSGALAAECETFLRLDRGGPGKSRLVPVLCEDARATELPSELRGLAAISLGSEGWRDRLMCLLRSLSNEHVSHSGHDREQTSTMGSSAPDREARALRELTRVFNERDEAVHHARNAGFPESRTPAFNTPLQFWNKVAEEARNGVLPNGMVPIIELANQMYPNNPIFADYCRTRSGQSGARC